MSIFRLGILIVAVVLVWSALLAPAEAQVGEVRTITQADATSGCIGNPITPECALEAFLACGVRHELDLCATVGIRYPDYVYSWGPVFVDYWFIESRVLGENHIPEDKRHLFALGPGDVEVTVHERFCDVSGPRCAYAQEWTHYYVLKPVEGRWHIASNTGSIGTGGPTGMHFGPIGTFERVTPDGATSGCIGDPRTPLCAVETFLACTIRRDLELCRSVGVEKLDFVPFEGEGFTDYRIMANSILSGDEVAEDKQYLFGFERGDAEIAVHKRTCDFLSNCSDWAPYSGRTLYYIVKPVAGLWQVASMGPAGPIGSLERITPAGATSDCIGDPATPVCAVETFLACAILKDVDLCRAVGVEAPHGVGVGELTAVSYQFQRQASEDGIVLAHLSEFRCFMERCVGSEPTYYALQPADGRWRLHAWGGGFPPPPEFQLSVIAQTDATSSCVGDPVTPLCAAETLLACFARKEGDLCESLCLSRGRTGETYTLEYVLAETILIEPDDPRRHARDPSAVEVEWEFRERACRDGPSPCPERELVPYWIGVVKQQGEKAWRVEYWYSANSA